MKLFATLDRFWFSKGNPVALGVLRIFIGWMALVDLCINSFDFYTWYTEKGLVNQALATKYMFWNSNEFFEGTPLHFTLPFHIPRLSLLNGVVDERFTMALYVASVLAALLFMLGAWSRVSGFLLMAGMISLHTRDPLMIHSGDTLLRLAVIYLALSPSGAACSIDRLRALAKGKATIEIAPVLLTAQRLVAFQTAIVYLMTVQWKWQGYSWQNGTATWFPVHLEEFRRFALPEFLDHQPFLLITTYSALIMQLGVGFLAFHPPFRRYVLLLGVFMHAFIDYKFNIPMFSWVITSTYVAYFSGEEVSAWFQKVGKKWGDRLKIRIPISAPDPVLNALNSFGLIRFGSEPPTEPVPTAPASG